MNNSILRVLQKYYINIYYFDEKFNPMFELAYLLFIYLRHIFPLTAFQNDVKIINLFFK